MKNNLTLFAREGKAKSLQNTGGGTSQQSAAQHDSARVFNYFNTQMARFLWNKKGEATVSKSSCSWAQGRATSAEQPTNHALITHLSPTQTVSLARIWKYVACLLLVLFVGVGNVWGQTLIEADDMETTSDGKISGWSKNDCTISQSTEARTGTYSLKTEYDGTGEKAIKTTNASMSVAKNEYLHVIAWTKLESSDATSASSDTHARPNAYIGGNGTRNGVNLTTTWQQITSNKKASSAVSNAYALLQRKHASKLAVLFDDVVIYKSTNATTDVTAPTAATSASATTSEISWTNGSDANTGRQYTLIWKRNTGNTHDLSLNNQGVYAADDADQSGNWTCLSATVAKGTDASESTYEAELASGEYAIVHRDLAYNYSTPTYVTIAGGGEDPSCEATADAGADKSTTVGVGVAMAATAASDGFTGGWSIKSGSPSTDAGQLGMTSSNTMTFTPSTYGTYTLVWTVTSTSDGTCKATDEATVTVPAPTHEISYTNTKGAANSNPATYTEGTGIASFAKLRHVVGYDFTGWSPSSISTSANTDQTIEAQWSANAVATGNASLTYAFAFASSTITTSSITRVNGALYDATDVSTTHTSYKSGGEANNNGCSGKLTTTSAKSESNYVELTFKIASGYTFTPSTISVKANAVSNAKTMEVELTDNAATPNTKSVTGNLAAGSTNGGVNYDLDFSSDPVTLEGTVTMKIYVYGSTGATDGWRLGTSIVISGTVAVPATPCDATAPGDIEKGEASGGTGKITLKVEDDGEPVTGDAWYWQSSASGEDDEDVYDAENGKEVSAAGTYYLRSYNTAGECWSAAKSVTVDAADLLTAISPTLSYATSNIVVGNTSFPTLEGNTGSGSVSYALNNVSPAGSLTIDENTGAVTAVTVGGTATVTATIAANGGYAGNTATSGTITVVAPATGTATVSYALSGSTTTGTVSGVSTISSLSSSFALSTLAIGDAKSGYSGQVTGMPTELSETAYADIQFTVASGYTFTPSSVTLQANPFKSTGGMHVVAKLMDANIEVTSNDINLSKGEGTGMDNDITFASGAFTGKEFTGTVHLRIFMYNSTSGKNCYIKSPISITGTVATKVVKYDLSFAAGTGASGTMSTLKYAASTEVTLPACTFTAPSGKEFDAWVVTKTVGGASVTVTNGKFTMPAEAVTATATWKDRPKHTDATLSDLTVGGETVDDFDAATTSYNVELPFGTFAAPTVAATATDAEYVKSVVVTQALSATGDATVVVTAEDGSTAKTYTVHFSVEDSKDIRMVWKTTGNPCGESSAPTAVVLSTNDAIKDYLSISFVQTTEDNSKKAEEKSDGYLSTGKSVGNLVKITAKPGYAFKNMSFYGKIETNEVQCPVSIDGGKTWTNVTGNLGSDAQHCDVFTNEEAHEIILKNNAGSGTWLRHMDLTMIQACTPKTIAWTTVPATEYEVGKSGYAIAASANNGTVTYASDDADVIAVNSSNGALTLKALGTVTLSASVPAGDGVTYCDEGAQVSKANVKTYYLVTFDAQNETTPATVKYYKNDAAIALPEDPTYSGFNFLGWYDASTGGTEVASAITPTASRTVYAQWEAQCAGPTITAQPASASYFVGRTASALTCEATEGDEGELTYTWYSCDDAERTNPVALAGAPTPSTAAAGTFYYYCVVTEAGCAVERTSDVATITVSEKDMLCLIQATHKNATEATIAGYIGGTADKNTQGGSKLGSKGHYFGIQLASGTFQAGDVVLLRTADGADTNGDKVRIFKSNAASAENVLVEGTEAMIYGDNYVTLPETSLNQLYLRRGTDEENYNKDWNPYIAVFAVYRPFPKPLLTGIKIDEAVAVVDENDATVYNVTIPAGSNLASLDVVPTFLSNDPSLTNGAVSGSWAIGSNTYVVTDKDGDSKSYTINIARDVAVASVSVSGETTVAAKSQITLTATVLPAEVSNKAVTWSSSDETKATVDANGVVTGKAAGSVTITATSVADNTKKGTLDIEVTKFVGTERVYWFAYAADAEANGVENNSEVFGSAPTGSNNGGFELTLEEGWTVTTTKKAGSTTLATTFTVPTDFTATLYAVVKGSGSSGRYIQLKQSDVVKYTSEEFGSADPTVLKIDGVAAGTYTIANEGGLSNFYLFAAELNSYPLTGVALEEGFNLRLGQSRTPVFTITPAKAAVASQEWSVVSRTGASDANLNTSTGEITAGTEEGTLTVKVSVTDAFGNEAESGNCVVKIVNIIDQKDVTGSMTWNWTGAGTANVSIGNEEALVLGNYIDGDQWAYIKGTKNDYAYNANNSGCYQGKGTLSFKTTVPGLVTITARRISNNADLKIGEDVVLSLTDSKKTSKAYFVPAGEVNIIADATEGMRILKIEFDANITADKAEGSHFGGHTRLVSEGQMTTVCVDHNVPAGCIVGAEVYKLLYWKYGTSYADCQMVDFEQVEEMNAGEPYMVLPTESTFALFYGKTTVDEPKAMSNGFTGTFDAIDQEYDNILVGKYAIIGTTVLKLGHNCGCSANRAYIDLSQTPSKEQYEASLTPSQSQAPKKRVSLGRKSEHVATGMDGINVENEQVQKVMIDGQMYIVRGGHIYNATGILVK